MNTSLFTLKPISFIIVIASCQLLLTIQIKAEQTATVTIFEANDFTKLLLKANLDSNECVDLSNYLEDTAGSLITTTCLIVYTEHECTGTSIKLDSKQNSGRYDLFEVRHDPEEHFGRRVKSFMKCNAKEGGNFVNVDFYSAPGNDDLTYTYQDICECMDIPSLNANFGSLHKINNHGNCVNLYTGTSCTGKSFEIKGGQSSRSENLDRLSSMFLSISPCGDFQNACVSLTATAVKFHIMSNSSDAPPSNVAMAAITTFHNNGSAKVSQTYSAKKTMKEVYETYRNLKSSSIHKVNVAVNINAEFSSGIPFLGRTKISGSLSAAYNYEHSSSSEDSSRFVSEETVEYFVEQNIEIPSCNLYEVSSYVSFLENYPIDYDVTFEVTGTFRGGRVLNAEELKSRLESMEFVDIKNNNTVFAKSYGNMVSSFGYEAVISGKGSPIEGCKIVIPQKLYI